MLEFEWDDKKNEINRSKLGWDFSDAIRVFGDPFVFEGEDRSLDYGEARMKATGAWPSVDLSRSSTRSAAESFGQFLLARQRRKSVLIMKKPATELDKTDWARIDAMTDEEAEANALSDPDNPPASEEQLKQMRRISIAKHLRFKLMLTQEEFAARYQIPLGTLRDWEQHRSEPDQATRAYLKVIAADPEGVARALRGEAKADRLPRAS